MTSLRSAAAMTAVSGVWLMDVENVAIEIFDCGDLLCGRVIWLKNSRDAQGLPKRDAKNPDPSLRGRQICGPTIIWAAHATSPNRWEEGWFYNPDDGRTYRISMELISPDLLSARIYLGFSIFGKTTNLVRIAQGTSEGWC